MFSKSSFHHCCLFTSALIVAMAGALPAIAAGPLAVPTASAAARSVLDPQLANITGQIEIVVQLDDLPLALAHGANAKQTGGWLPRGQQHDHLARLKAKQDALVAKAQSLGGVELGRMTKALNAVALRIEAAQLPALASLTNVVSIRPVVNYHLDLSETVPYVGATAVQATGVDGAGTRVALLDTGVDYTHRNLGGPGTIAAYQAAYGTNSADPRNTTLDGLFPTAKVIGGYDFVGENWPNAA